jgi:radical SAM superfamily enzyme YgiQ (UPF0313 family)
MNKKRILILNPPINDFSQYDLFSKPYGLLRIAKLLNILNVDFDFIDCMDKYLPYFSNRNKYIKGKTKEDGTGKFYKFEIEIPEKLKITNKKYFRFGLSNEDFFDFLSNLKEFDYVFININFSFHYNIIYEIVPIIKKHSKNSKIYLGGIFSKLAKYDILNNFGNLFKFIDGIAPQNINEFLVFLIQNNITKEDPIMKIKKFFFKEQIYKIKDNCFQNSFNENFNNIIIKDSFILPYWDLYDKLDYGILRTTVGCPFNCKYCASKLIDPKYEEIEDNFIIDEIEYFFKRKIFNIAFYDDALLLNKSHLINIFKKIEQIKERFENNLKTDLFYNYLINDKINDINNKISFYLPNAIHIKFFDEEIAEWFKKLNFKMIRFGFESLDEEKNKIRGEKFGKDDILRVINIIEKARINKDYIKFYLLIGLPDQTFEEVKYSVNFLTENGLKTYFAFYSPIKGTYYYNIILENFKKGIIKNDIEDFLWHNPAIYTFFNTDFNEDIVRSYKRCSREGKIIT